MRRMEGSSAVKTDLINFKAVFCFLVLKGFHRDKKNQASSRQLKSTQASSNKTQWPFRKIRERLEQAAACPALVLKST